MAIIVGAALATQGHHEDVWESIGVSLTLGVSSKGCLRSGNSNHCWIFYRQYPRINGCGKCLLVLFNRCWNHYQIG